MNNLKTFEEILEQTITESNNKHYWHSDEDLSKKHISKVTDKLPPDGVGCIAFDKNDNTYFVYWDTHKGTWISLERRKLPELVKYYIR